MTNPPFGDDTFLTGQMLIAMPGMEDSRFSDSVIYLCSHGEDGAMGLIVNREIDSLNFPDLLSQLGIKTPSPEQEIRVMLGGPVEPGRGFVLHSTDYVREATLLIGEGRIGLTATLEILQDMAQGTGPSQSLLALGYAGWGPGQLDAEILANGWLHAPADPALMFSTPPRARRTEALARLGIDAVALSRDAGHA